MTDLAEAARRILATTPGRDVADRAARVCEQLAHHLSRVIGEHGVDALLNRSIALSSGKFPWLSREGSDPVPDGRACSALRDAMERQDPDAATDAFSAVLATFVGLLKRLIGPGLVERLLGEVWPAIFPVL